MGSQVLEIQAEENQDRAELQKLNDVTQIKLVTQVPPSPYMIHLGFFKPSNSYSRRLHLAG